MRLKYEPASKPKPRTLNPEPSSQILNEQMERETTKTNIPVPPIVHIKDYEKQVSTLQPQPYCKVKATKFIEKLNQQRFRKSGGGGSQPYNLNPEPVLQTLPLLLLFYPLSQFFRTALLSGFQK